MQLLMHGTEDLPSALAVELVRSKVPGIITGLGYSGGVQ